MDLHGASWCYSSAKNHQKASKPSGLRGKDWDQVANLRQLHPILLLGRKSGGPNMILRIRLVRGNACVTKNADQNAKHTKPQEHFIAFHLINFCVFS
jgi:hypothetical protein